MSDKSVRQLIDDAYAEQRAQWSVEHDASHSASDWVALIVMRLGPACESQEAFTKAMAEVAALATSALEVHRSGYSSPKMFANSEVV